MAEPEEDIKQEFAGVSRQTKSENQIIYICDFRRYEKSAFSNILLQSRSSQTTNIDDLILGLLFLGCRANQQKDLGKKSGEIEVIRVNPSKKSYNESYNPLERPQIPPTINSNSIPSQNTALCKINKAYLWPRSKGWMRALLREHSTCSD